MQMNVVLQCMNISERDFDSLNMVNAWLRKSSTYGTTRVKNREILTNFKKTNQPTNQLKNPTCTCHKHYEYFDHTLPFTWIMVPPTTIHLLTGIQYWKTNEVVKIPVSR